MHLPETPAHDLHVGHAVDGRIESDVPFSIRETQADERGHVLSLCTPNQDRHDQSPSIPLPHRKTHGATQDGANVD